MRNINKYYILYIKGKEYIHMNSTSNSFYLQFLQYFIFLHFFILHIKCALKLLRLRYEIFMHIYLKSLKYLYTVGLLSTLYMYLKLPNYVLAFQSTFFYQKYDNLLHILCIFLDKSWYYCEEQKLKLNIMYNNRYISTLYYVIKNTNIVYMVRFL